MEDVFGNRIVFAEQDKIHVYGIEMKRVLSAIAFFMSDDPEKWLPKVWVSDRSTIGDFYLEDKDLASIAESLNVTLDEYTYLWEIAKAIHDREGL